MSSSESRLAVQHVGVTSRAPDHTSWLPLAASSTYYMIVHSPIQCSDLFVNSQ